LAYFAGEADASFFAAAIEDIPKLIVPSITLYEVYKRVLQQRGEDNALQAIAAMMQGRVIDLNSNIALAAARLGIECKLPLADSIVLMTAQLHEALLWTQDADFEGIVGVRYRAKKAGNTKRG
jgi:predicted nucleic acid-binding protein